MQRINTCAAVAASGCFCCCWRRATEHYIPEVAKKFHVTADDFAMCAAASSGHAPQPLHTFLQALGGDIVLAERELLICEKNRKSQSIESYACIRRYIL
jgi:hypothetical protein